MSKGLVNRLIQYLTKNSLPTDITNTRDASASKNECNHPRKEIRDWEVLFVGLVVNQVLFWEMKVVNQYLTVRLNVMSLGLKNLNLEIWKQNNPFHLHGIALYLMVLHGIA